MTTIAVKRPGEAKLKDLFKPGTVGKYTVKNRIKYGACCVSNYNGRDGSITPRELARVRATQCRRPLKRLGLLGLGRRQTRKP